MTVVTVTEEVTNNDTEWNTSTILNTQQSKTQHHDATENLRVWIAKLQHSEMRQILILQNNNATMQ